jgi:hypothetical protein
VRPVQVRVKQADLAGTLAAMREWLDREKCTHSSFLHKGDGVGIIVITATFAIGDHACAEAFQQYFDQVG